MRTLECEECPSPGLGADKVTSGEIKSNSSTEKRGLRKLWEQTEGVVQAGTGMQEEPSWLRTPPGDSHQNWGVQWGAGRRQDFTPALTLTDIRYVIPALPMTCQWYSLNTVPKHYLVTCVLLHGTSVTVTENDGHSSPCPRASIFPRKATGTPQSLGAGLAPLFPLPLILWVHIWYLSVWELSSGYHHASVPLSLPR